MILAMCLFLFNSLYSGTNELISPIPGSEYTIHKIELKPSDFGPGSTGENISWIMTDTTVGEIINIKAISPSSSTFSNYFKKADIIIESNFYSNSEFNNCQKHYYFYTSGNGRLIKIGRLDIDTVLNQNYLTSFSNPEIVLEKSIYYNKSLSDRWEGSYLNHVTNNQINWIDGLTEYIVDGTGELRIDGNIIPDIYRIRRIRSYTETIDADSSILHSVTSYEWWSTQIPFPLINMEQRSVSNAQDKYYMYYLDKSHYIDVGILERGDSGIGLNLFPNPSNGRFSLTFSLKVDADIQLEILDATGRLIKVLDEVSTIAGEHTLSYDFKGNPGVYFIRAIVDGTQSMKKLIIT